MFKSSNDGLIIDHQDLMTEPADLKDIIEDTKLIEGVDLDKRLESTYSIDVDLPSKQELHASSTFFSDEKC